jgi:uncharacterized protein (TIGR01777 family)
MRIVMAGSSGFLGTHLRRRLVAQGHEIVQLVRREPGPGQKRWWPDHGELDPEILSGADAVVNLAGAGVTDRRWTESYKRVLASSRVDPTATLADTIAGLPEHRRPRTMLNASGVHFYGDTGDETVDEGSPPGKGFLPQVCQAWEAAAAPAENAGARVIRLRTGLVLDRSAGFLKPVHLAFRLFAGGRLGNGRQWMPWIALDDWLSAATLLLARADIAGPVNVVGPEPVRNADFSRALGTAMHRPALVPTPTFALRIVLGEFANEALQSLRVLPAVLRRAGFEFRYADLDSALRAALDGDQAKPGGR